MRDQRTKAATPLACALLCGLGGLGLSCTGGSHDRGIPDAGGHSYARLAITLTTAREGNLTIGTSARLMRYRGVDVESAQVLAGSPTAAREVAPAARAARCAVIDDEALLDDALATSPPDAAVQMLDAGDLLFHVAGQTVRIAPRYVPDIVPFVSGVVYDAEVSSRFGAIDPIDPAGPGQAPGSARTDDAYIAASGGQQIGRFVTAAEVPSAPRLLAINGVAVESRPSIDRDADLTLSWFPEAAGRGQLQVVLAGDFGPAVRCTVADSGRFTIPAALVARVADALHGEPLTLAVERSRRTPFSAPGIEAADVEITARDAVVLH